MLKNIKKKFVPSFGTEFTAPTNEDFADLLENAAQYQVKEGTVFFSNCLSISFFFSIISDYFCETRTSLSNYPLHFNIRCLIYLNAPEMQIDLTNHDVRQFKSRFINLSSILKKHLFPKSKCSSLSTNLFVSL